MTKYKNLIRVAMKELEKLDSMYEGKSEFTKDDAEKFRILAHAWKCLLTAEAMYNAEEMPEDQGGGMSYARGRNMYNGRYMSREMDPAMSGHYPPAWYPHTNYDWRY